MEPAEKPITHTHSDVVAEALSATRKAEELKGTAIKQLLEQRTQIELDLKSLGYTEAPHSNGDGVAKHSESNTVHPAVVQARSSNQTKRFKGVILAEVARALIAENSGPLHGKEIERLAKAGGFIGGTNNFQNYLPVALKRDGGFENIGGNTWKLKEFAK
jgi:hypothetical protein